MRYMIVEIHKTSMLVPSIIYSEIDSEHYEVRKIEIFSNGHTGFATEILEFGGTGLSDKPIPSVESINETPGFYAKELKHSEFEDAWSKYTKQL
ncbi:hypothetical protein GK047_20365 [Paenibacillus sp. SYP-B3998]|uniref:DUF6881 domain-containing protein n=1 Tax=Paenibacillus sp. SYP-B3998 TaxID=2678564 RepID=A0A6G4A1I9_9BACL|nr:hypothetical protein [Paenibacillus sp. SYP-B3998]NEW08356.1 hypothetical protein [Paenibacillus sp. SYP-B3998]